jgi:hypothetical protein
MFLDWANRGLNLWTIEEVAVNLTGTTSITLPTDTVQVLTAVIRDFSQSPVVDITIDPITCRDCDDAFSIEPSENNNDEINILRVCLFVFHGSICCYQSLDL